MIEDQVKLNEIESQEIKPNINLRDLFIEKKDPIKRQ